VGDAAGIELKASPGITHACDFPSPARTNRLGHHMADGDGRGGKPAGDRGLS